MNKFEIKQNKVKRQDVSYRLALCVFTLPALVLFLTFAVYPLIPELFISLQDHNGYVSKGWVGFKNYADVLTSESFWMAQKNTILVVWVALVISFPISLIFALLMDAAPPRLRNFFKIAAVFPSVLSVTVVAKMWVAIYETKWGLVNTVLRWIGLEGLTKVWLADPNTAMIAITIGYVWQYLGINALMLYTGIKAIPKSYFESALIDGAGFWKASFHITIPLLKDVMKYVVTTLTLGSLGMFSYVNVMTKGGPGFLTRTLTYEMYYRAFDASKFGQGCAIALIFIAESICISLIINKVFGNEKIEY